MKILLYFENLNLLSKSGIGRAFLHQTAALKSVGIEYTTDVKCKDYDLLHINTCGARGAVIIAKAKRMGKPVVYHAHSTMEDFRNSFVGSNKMAFFVRLALTNLYNMADQIITPTEYAKGLLAKHGIKPPISVISNGVELARFTSDSRKKEAFMREFGVADGQKTVIGVGMYFVRKGILDFVDVAKSFPQYRFIWFGYTPVRLIPGAVRKAVRNPPSNVEFPGYISGDVIEGAYENADLFFFPSYEETEGIVVLEALAARQNILVRNIPVYDGWLKNGQNCYMEADTKGFLNTLPRIINGELPSTGRNARASVEDKRLENIGTQLKFVYNKALREYKPPEYK